jgi:hypothetical protein
MAWLTKWLNDEWTSAWRWIQTWLGVAIMAAPQVYDNVQTLQAFLPATWFRVIMSILGGAVIINTLRKKKADSPPPEPTQ